MPTPKPLIGYRRVSTEEQEESGLGLEAQDMTLRSYASQTGRPLLRTYTEVETGKNNDRPELSKAFAHAKRAGAVLAVAVLDRLSRNSYFINCLLESGVEFVDCQSPNDTPLVTRIKAACAQDELERISQRTKAALAAIKARGGKLGAHLPNAKPLTAAARRKGAIAAGKLSAARAQQAYADIAPLMQEWRTAGCTQQTIADRLNEEGHTTRCGKRWGQVQVRRVLRRIVYAIAASG